MKQLSLSQAKLLSELTIPVQVIVGEISLSAADLIDLKGGENFPIQIEKESPVTLFVAGERIAKGKLTKEEGEIYIQVTEIFSELRETDLQVCSILNEPDNKENLI